MNYYVASHIHYRALGDEVIVLDEHRETYLGLNPTAATIWIALAEGGSSEQAAREVANRFSTTIDNAKVDVERFITDLVRDGLLVELTPS